MLAGWRSLVAGASSGVGTHMAGVLAGNKDARGAAEALDGPPELLLGDAGGYITAVTISGADDHRG